MRQSHINSCFKPCSIWAFFLGSGRNIVNPACLWVKKKRNISTIVKLIMINKTQWQWKLPLHFRQLCFAFSFVSFLFSFCSLFLICFMTSRWIVCRSWGPRVCVMSGKTHIQYTKGKKILKIPSVDWKTVRYPYFRLVFREFSLEKLKFRSWQCQSTRGCRRLTKNSEDWVYRKRQAKWRVENSNKKDGLWFSDRSISNSIIVFSLVHD